MVFISDIMLIDTNIIAKDFNKEYLFKTNTSLNLKRKKSNWNFYSVLPRINLSNKILPKPIYIFEVIKECRQQRFITKLFWVY